MSKRPNILLIVADQHRFDCAGFAGNSQIQTPHLDAIARDGTVFESCFCPAPLCTPSRYSLLTGLYPHQHGATNNHSTIFGGLDTFATVLQRAGYRTAAVGKMHLTPTYLDVGFNSMLLAEQDGDGRFDDDYHLYLREQGLCDRLDLIDQRRQYRDQAPREYWRNFGALPSDLPEEHHSTSWIGRHALEAIERWGDEGELLMVSFIKPHHPFDPPAPWSEIYDPQTLELLSGWSDALSDRDALLSPGYFSNCDLDEATLRRVMALYYGSISHLDHWIGELTARLREKGLYDDTLVVYLSDHGEFLGFHHLLLKGNWMYDPLVKVPLVVKWPGSVQAAERCDDLCSTLDVAPTILANAGCPIPAKFVGRDLSRRDLTQSEEPKYVFAEVGQGRHYMVRSRRFKLLRHPFNGNSLFFDLEADPLETRNLWGEAAYGNEIAAHDAALSQWMLFDTPTRPFLDENGPTIAPSNPRDGEHRRQMAEFFDELMQNSSSSDF